MSPEGVGQSKRFVTALWYYLVFCFNTNSHLNYGNITKIKHFIEISNNIGVHVLQHKHNIDENIVSVISKYSSHGDNILQPPKSRHHHYMITTIYQ